MLKLTWQWIKLHVARLECGKVYAMPIITNLLPFYVLLWMYKVHTLCISSLSFVFPKIIMLILKGMIINPICSPWRKMKFKGKACLHAAKRLDEHDRIRARLPLDLQRRVNMILKLNEVQIIYFKSYFYWLHLCCYIDKTDYTIHKVNAPSNSFAQGKRYLN